MSRELCIMACAFCRDKLFQKWLDEQITEAFGVCEPGDTKEFISASCGIESRKELDTNPEAAHLFHAVIRKPFLAWKEKQ